MIKLFMLLLRKKKINPHKFESIIYSILSAFLSKGRYNEAGGNLDPDQLAMGIKVEMEHTSDPAIAKRIASDHLAEFPQYYTYLAKMESELSKLNKKKEKK